jgi:hypothetical protein
MINGLDPIYDRQHAAAHRLLRQARMHTKQIYTDWVEIHGPSEPWKDAPVVGPLKAFLIRHPMRSATKWTAAIHEAGHFVLFERTGMRPFKAQIIGSAFGRWGWRGTAGAWNRAGYSPRLEDWDLSLVKGECLSAFGGPIAEELLGGGCALSSIGELVGGSLWAAHAGELKGHSENVAVVTALIETISIVERHAAEILRIAELLIRWKRIGRDYCLVNEILENVARGPIKTGPISARGQALCDKIRGAFDHLWFLAPLATELTDSDLEEAA